MHLIPASDIVLNLTFHDALSRLYHIQQRAGIILQIHSSDLQMDVLRGGGVSELLLPPPSFHLCPSVGWIQSETA